MTIDSSQQNKQDKIDEQNAISQLKKIRNSLRALQDAVVLLDDNDGLEWWNQAAEDLLLLSSTDQGTSIFDFITVAEFQQYYQTRPTPNDGVHIASMRDPNRYLKCELTPFGNEKLLIIGDVTRLHHLEQMRQDFVANVSHELRTPLTVLSGYVEMFSEQDDLDPRWQRGFAQMQQQTQRMTAIIEDLLLLSRLENEELGNKDQVIAVAPLLQQLFEDATAYNADYGHQLHLHIDSGLNLRGSAHELASAFSNLITNAIKYTPRGGSIHIGWQHDNEQAYFYVQDNGIGIEAHHISRLTERFYRIDSARSREAGGTGLGLAIVKHVLAQHDAYLDIVSTPNQGTTFKAIFDQSRLLQ